MLSLAERFTNKLEQPRFTWLPHYLAKAINLCGQACKAGLSLQIAHNQEVCVQLCICPSQTQQSLDSGIMNGSCWSHCVQYFIWLGKSLLRIISIMLHCVELGEGSEFWVYYADKILCFANVLVLTSKLIQIRCAVFILFSRIKWESKLTWLHRSLPIL